MDRDRILVIDDDPDLRELVALLLLDWGLTVLDAPTCADALPILERERGRLRVVLLDYFMPGLAPCDCVREILARIEPEVPVVLVTAAVDAAERARELGLSRFLAKPFEPADLRHVVLGGAKR